MKNVSKENIRKTPRTDYLFESWTETHGILGETRKLAEELEIENQKLQEMFDLQVKLVTALELDKMKQDETLELGNKLAWECERILGLGLQQNTVERLKTALKDWQEKTSSDTTIQCSDKFAEASEKIKQLEYDNEELRNIIESLTKGKLPCNPDHNGECLVCDNITCDCPLIKK